MTQYLTGAQLSEAEVNEQNAIISRESQYISFVCFHTICPHAAKHRLFNKAIFLVIVEQRSESVIHKMSSFSALSLELFAFAN